MTQYTSLTSPRFSGISTGAAPKENLYTRTFAIHDKTEEISITDVMKLLEEDTFEGRKLVKSPHPLPNSDETDGEHVQTYRDNQKEYKILDGPSGFKLTISNLFHTTGEKDTIKLLKAITHKNKKQELENLVEKHNQPGGTTQLSLRPLPNGLRSHDTHKNSAPPTENSSPAESHIDKLPNELHALIAKKLLNQDLFSAVWDLSQLGDVNKHWREVAIEASRDIDGMGIHHLRCIGGRFPNSSILRSIEGKE